MSQITTQQNETMAWNCAICTFLNNNASNQCSMCYTMKPTEHQNYIINNNNNQYINSSNTDYNDYYDEYSYYDKQSEYNQYEDVEWDSMNQKLTTFTLSRNKKKGKKKNKKNKEKVVEILDDSNKEKKQQNKQENNNNNKNIKKSEEINTENLNYKQYAKNICKWYIRWNNKPNHIFPDYRDVSGSTVSQKRINTAKKIVALLLKQESKKITKAWQQFTSKRYYGKRMILKVDIENAIKRVNSTKLQQDDDETYGEADEESIWITECQLSDEGLVGTILHEALHFMATLNGKEICEKDEHFVIKMLGDDEC